MATSYTDNLRFTLQGTGDNSGTWGVVANNGVFELVEDAVAGILTKPITGTGDVVLTTGNGVTDEARNMIIKLTGTPSGSKNIIIPSASKVYVVEVSTSASVPLTLKAGGSIGVNLTQGTRTFAYCDGLNVFEIAPSGVLRASNNLSDLTDVSVAQVNLGLLPGTNVQAFSPILQGIANTSVNGFLVRTSVSGAAARVLTAGAGVSILNGTGISGDPTFSLVPSTTSTIGGLIVATSAEVSIGTANDRAITPLNLKGALGLTRFYDSGEQVVDTSLKTLTHGLGAVPKSLEAYAVCKTVDGGYAVGDTLPFNSFFAANSGFRSLGCNTTQVFYSYNAALFPTKPGNNFFALTPANWRIIIRAWT